MSQRSVRHLVPAAELNEGAGVTVHRTIGTPRLRHLDPFLMLDHFGSREPDEYIAGFPDHPHRGFITLTHMIDGHMLHRDSMGNRGDLRSGGIQWMKAASGVIHSEMPQQSDGLMRGFQLWINLPAAEKMSDPEYQDVPAERIPVIEENGQRIKLIAGEHGDRRGPIVDRHTQIQYLDVALARGRTFHRTVSPDVIAFAYVFEGEARCGDTPLPPHTLVVFGEGDDVEVAAGEPGARFIFVAGRPIGEPIVQYGPFVMTSEAEIRQAIEDYRHGRLARRPPGTVSA